MDSYVYHLTSLENFKSILENGYIYSRNKMKETGYADTAEPDIIGKRGNWNDYVPFHFTMDTRYTYAVRLNNAGKAMINLAFPRSNFYSEENKFTLGHPVSDSKGISYTEKNYNEHSENINENKAELLVCEKVAICKLAAVYVGEQNKEYKKEIDDLLQKYHINVHVNN